jgi:hypothetical protein
VLHIDIIDGKIWIQHDGTTEGAAETLVAAGVPQEAIVLGFQSPERRKLTAFAPAWHRTADKVLLSYGGQRI